jgi:hypothetical protein
MAFIIRIHELNKEAKDIKSYYFAEFLFVIGKWRWFRKNHVEKLALLTLLQDEALVFTDLSSVQAAIVELEKLSLDQEYSIVEVVLKK